MYHVRVENGCFHLHGEKAQLSAGTVINGQHGVFICNGDELVYRPKGGRPPLRVPGTQRGWFTFRGDRVELDWVFMTLEAFGRPFEILETCEKLPARGCSKEQAWEDTNCRAVPEKDDVRRIARLYITPQCEQRELEALLSHATFGYPSWGFVDAYWNLETAVRYLGNCYKAKEQTDFGYPANGNTQVLLKGESGTEEQIFIHGTPDDCGMALVLYSAIRTPDDEHMTLPLVPACSFRKVVDVLRPAQRLLRRHGWRAFDALLTDRHRTIMTEFDKGPRSIARFLARRYGIKFVPGVVMETSRFFLARSNPNVDNSRAMHLTVQQLGRHRVDLASCCLAFGEPFLEELIAAAGAIPGTWVTGQPHFRRLLQDDDGVVLGVDDDAERHSHPLGNISELTSLTPEDFRAADDLADLVCGPNPQQLEFVTFLRTPLSPPVYFSGFDDPGIAYIFTPPRPVQVYAVIKVRGHIEHYVRGVLVHPDGRTEPLTKKSSGRSFRGAAFDGAELLW